MKKMFFLIAAAAAVILSPSCTKKENKLEMITASVIVDESGLAQDVVKPESYKVTMINQNTGAKLEFISQNGVATAKELLPGIYSVTVEASISSGAYNYIISGEEASAKILLDGAKITIKLIASKESSLIFKEIFYNGTKVQERTNPDDPLSEVTYFRDQFYEIYNNGTETLYADGLCLANNLYADDEYSVIYQWNIPEPEKYVFVQTVWQIPGDGKTYPIAPGESIIVAQWAADHRAENLAKGKSLNLSGADFEAIEKEKTLWNGIVITDNPAINMKNAVNSTGNERPQWLVSVFNSSIILFRPSKELENKNFIVAKNYIYESEKDTREVAIADILDAVQWKPTEADWAEPKKRHLPAVLDAGCNIIGGEYTGKSIARKIKGTRKDGTAIYQDTNNTSNDFESQAKPEIRRNGAKKPSWNTWGK